MNLIETPRLTLRYLTLNDGPFIIELLNDPAFIKNIADRKVRTLEDAKNYLINTPLKSYKEHGFGLFMVEEKSTQKPVGMCGLIKRPHLEDVDLGFAFLPAFCGKGYATESSQAVIQYGKDKIGLKRLVAIVNPDNSSSINVIEKLGFKFEKNVKLPNETLDIKLFALE